MNFFLKKKIVSLKFYLSKISSTSIQMLRNTCEKTNLLYSSKPTHEQFVNNMF